MTNTTTQDREMALSSTLNTPVALVWEVWTKPEHIAHWWGPNGFTTTIRVMEVRPGGQWNLVMHSPDGKDFDNKTIFREVIPGKKLVFEHVSYPRFVATIDFEEKGDQTAITWRMLFETAEVCKEIAETHKAREGQKQNMEKLHAYLTGLDKTIKHA